MPTEIEIRDSWIPFVPQPGDLVQFRDPNGSRVGRPGTQLRFIEICREAGRDSTWNLENLDCGWENNKGWYCWRFEPAIPLTAEELEKRKYNGIIEKINKSYKRQKENGILL